MSVGPEQNVDVNLIEQTRRQINQLVEEVARLSELDLAPAEYYGEFLQRVLDAVAAPAGAIWVRSPQGHLQLQYQINMREVGLDSESDRESHNELLRQAVLRAQPLLVPPHSSSGPAEGGQASAGNPTRYVILMAPILVDKQVAGLIEVWQDADRNPNAQRGFLQFLVRMAELASSYTRNHRLRDMVGQQQVWTQLEAFARQIHNSLNPTEVSYLVANEGRRLINCDRVSVGQRMAKKTRIEAVSGADVVERRSNLVRLMSKLMDSVLVWGEKLTYSGTKDDSLPPDVLSALDAYLAESNSKLLVALPLRDEREENKKKPPRTCVLMECFDPQASTEQLLARMEVVGRHATSALYNAAEHKRIPLRFLWAPLAKVQEGLGGKAKAITYSVLAALVVLLLVLVFVPYPLKMDSKGQLLPEERRYIFSPVDGAVVDFAVEPGSEVHKNQELVKMHDLQLELRLAKLRAEILGYEEKIRAIRTPGGGVGRDPRTSPAEIFRMETEALKYEARRRRAQEEFDSQVKLTNSDVSRLGHFWLKSPLDGKVLNSDFRENFINRQVKPNEPLLRIGLINGKWVIELKIPQKHIGQVLQGFDQPMKDMLVLALEDGVKAGIVSPDDVRAVNKKDLAALRQLANDKGVQVDLSQALLDVDLILLSKPTQTFKGKLARKDVAGEAQPNRDDNNEAEPVVVALVRIDGDDIPADKRIPEEYLVTGTEVHAKVRCGNRAMGYSLFYGVWEWFYEKVVFFF